ncbi:hypothetical protein NQ315_011580 [Exocentrus adspersus]|uniref:Peptidase S1 domain-containing protein n=1 Tax=Exocentrus adspersus TaxID=1586481 RepID=A0AAV8VV72_9CUCU|nr:hypothetical protein NQ315_011580 [Exocentrus adspersus]
MKVAAYLLASLSLSVALPAQNFSWNEVKGVNLILKPASNDYAVVDEPNNGRIIGGNESVPHSKPYQVGLLINGESFCSGSLISTSFVITAAHCVAGASFVELIFGAHNINIQEASQVRVTSRNIFSNPGYTALYPHNNDIALIKTPTPIVPNNYIPNHHPCSRKKLGPIEDS